MIPPGRVNLRVERHGRGWVWTVVHASDDVDGLLRGVVLARSGPPVADGQVVLRSMAHALGYVQPTGVLVSREVAELLVRWSSGRPYIIANTSCGRRRDVVESVRAQP